MSEGTKEMHLEDHIARYLSRDIKPDFSEYVTKDRSCYDKEMCIIPEDLVDFIKDTQPEKYAVIVD